MQVLLKKQIYAGHNATPIYKKFIEENAGKWVDVDTSCLFTDQYNTPGPDGVRLFDSQIDAVRDDARRDMGKCRYCGALVRRGDEEKHFSDREAAACVVDDSGVIVRPCAAGRCFWMSSRRINEKTAIEEKSIINGREVVKRTTWEREENFCRHADEVGKMSGGYVCKCERFECRARGVEWFTEKNTFFLKYPEGRGVPALLVPGESVKFGSYTLVRDRWSWGDDDFYTFANSRRRVLFVWDRCAEDWRVLRGIGYSGENNFGGVPFAVRENLRGFLLRRGEIWRAIERGFCDEARKKLAFSDLGGACLAVRARFEAEKRRDLTEAKTEKKRIAVFCDWCGGLASAFRPEFETFRQLDALRKCGGRVPSEDNAAAVYYNLIAAEFFAVCAWAEMAARGGAR